MTHEHEWELIPDWKYKALWFRCRHCGTEMEIDQAERRLNAVERLSAEDANRLKDMHFPVAYGDDDLCFKLYDYIATLGGFSLHPHTQNAAALEESPTT